MDYVPAQFVARGHYDVAGAASACCLNRLPKLRSGSGAYPAACAALGHARSAQGSDYCLRAGADDIFANYVKGHMYLLKTLFLYYNILCSLP
jgi:hypothetical protein